MKRCRFVGVAIGLLAILVSLFPTRFALATGGDEGFEKEVNGYQVRLHFPGHAKTGQNPVEIEITAPGGEALSVARVEVSAVPGAAHSEEEPQAHPEDADEEGHTEAEPHAAEGMDGHDGEAEPATHDDMEMHGEDTEMSSSDPHDAEPADTHAEESSGAHGESKEVILKPGKEPGEYAGKVFFSEAGDWAVKVRFTTDDGKVEEHVDFTVDVIDAGPNWTVLGGFFGINATIVAVAAVKKRKSTLVIPA